MGLAWAFVPVMIPAGAAVQFCWVLFFILKTCVVFTWLPALRALPLLSSDKWHLKRQVAPQAALGVFSFQSVFRYKRSVRHPWEHREMQAAAAGDAGGLLVRPGGCCPLPAPPVHPRTGCRLPGRSFVSPDSSVQCTPFWD